MRKYLDGSSSWVHESYIDFVMMRDVYHCDPITFYKLPHHTVQLHRDFLRLESKQRDIDARRAKQKAEAKKQ